MTNNCTRRIAKNTQTLICKEILIYSHMEQRRNKKLSRFTKISLGLPRMHNKYIIYNITNL